MYKGHNQHTEDAIYLPHQEYPVPGTPGSEFLYEKNGRRRTGSLFMETTHTKHFFPCMTMRDFPREGRNSVMLPSAYQMFMNSIDEYDAAQRIVGGLSHWRLLMRSSWFMNGDPEYGTSGLVQWRKDMHARDANEYKKKLKVLADNGDRGALTTLLSYAIKEQGIKVTPSDTQKSRPPRGKNTIKTKRSEAADRRDNDNVVDLDKAFSHVLGEAL